MEWGNPNSPDTRNGTQCLGKTWVRKEFLLTISNPISLTLIYVRFTLVDKATEIVKSVQAIKRLNPNLHGGTSWAGSLQ